MSATTMTVGNLVLTTAIDMTTLDRDLQQLNARIRQLESTTKLKIGVDTSAIDGGVTKATQGIQNLQRIASTPTVLKVDTAPATAAINTTTNAASRLKTVLESIGALAVLDVLVKGVKDIGDAMVGTNSKIQQATTSIEALTGSASTATEMVGKLENLASHSVFGLPQLTQSAQQLLAFGVNAKNVPPLLQAIQTAAAASGGDITDKLSRINYVISELNSGIPVSARQLRQLAMAGVPLDNIAKQLGITTEALFTAGKTGIVSGAQITEAFQKVYTTGNLGDFMQKQAGTFSGAMNLIKTNLSLAVAEGFKPLFDVISSLVVKFALFVQTPTFNQWVGQVRQGVTAVIEVLKELGRTLAPIGTTLADLFGLKTGNIAAEMEAVKKGTVDVGQYDAALQGATKTTADSAAASTKAADAAQAHTDALANVKTAAGALDQALGFPNGQKGIQETVANLGTLETTARDQAARAVSAVNDVLSLPNGSIGPKDASTFLGELKDAGAAATQVIQGLNAELAANKVLLDQNAASIQNVKNTYDPIIKSAEQHIRDINLLSPEELARKQRELELDKEKANLELRKPNTSVFDTAIATDKSALDAMPRLDTGVWDDAIKADDKKLKNFDASSYTKDTKAQIDTLQDTDVAAPFKKQAQDIQDAMASLDPEAATKSITDTIQAIRDKSAALDPEAATRSITDTIQGIRDSMAALDPTAATQGITDTIQGIRDSMSALDPEAATRGITDTIQGIQDAIHGLNTDALDQKINSIKDILAQPAPNTTGLNTAMAAIAAQIQGAGAGTDTSALQAQYGALSGQKTGIVRKYEQDTTGLKGQVKLLEQQRADQRLAQSETKRADEARIVDLTRQATAIKEGIADTKAADAARITELTRQAQAIKEGIADEKKGDEARIVNLTRQATQIKEGITDQKAADAARIVQLTRQATQIKEGIADEKAADAEKLRGIARDQAAAEKTKKTTLDTLNDTLKGEQATATADKKKIDLDRAWNQELKTNAVDLDRDARQKLTDDITHQERLKTAMLAPYTQQLAGITAQQQQNTLLDAAAAAQRKLDLAPYLAQLDQAKQKEQEALAPLLAKKQELDGIKSKLDEEKATWGGIKSAIDSAKSSLDNYFKSPVGGSGTSKGGAGIPPVAINPGSGAIPNPDIGSNAGDTTGGVPDSPILTQLKSLKQWLDEHGDTIKNAIKAMWHFDTGVFQFEVNAVSKIFQLGQDLWRGDWKKFVADLATINDEITTWLNDHGAQWATSFTELWKQIAGAYLGPDLRTQFAAVGGFFDDLGSKASEVGDTIKSGLGSAVQWIGDQFSNLGTTVEDTKNFLGEKFQDVQDAATRLKDWLGGIVGPGGLIGGFFDALGTKVRDVFQAIGNFFDALGFHANAFKENMATPMNLIGTMFSDLGTKADEWLGPNGKVGQFFDHTGTVAHALYDNSIGLIFGKGGLIGQAFDGVGSVASDWFAPGGKIGSFFDNVGTKAHTLYDDSIGKVFGTAGQVGTGFSDTGTVATDWFGPNGKIGSFFADVGNKAHALYDDSIGKVFGKGGLIGVAFNELGDLAHDWFAPGQKVGGFFDNVGSKAGDLRDGVTGAFTTLETWLGGWATRIGATVLAPFTAIGQGIHGFLTKIGEAVNWVGALFAFPAIDFSGIPGFAGGLDGKASGWGGGMAIVGEKGPEIMYVPAGANIATHEESKSLGLLPGFASGVGDFFHGIVDAAKGAKDKVGDLLGKGEQWAVSQAMSKLSPFPDHTGDLLAHVGTKMVSEVGDGLKKLIHDAFAAIPHTTSGHGSGSGQGVLGGSSIIPQDAVRAMTAFADSVAGQGYVWGGGHGNNNGYDCSGFVAAVLDAGGISNPHGIVTDFANWMEPGRTGKADIGVFNPNGDPTAQHMGIGLNGQWYEMGGRVPGPPGYSSGAGKTDDYFPIIGHPPGSFTASVSGGAGGGAATGDLSAVQQYISNPAVVGWLQDALSIDGAPSDWLPAMIIAAAGESSDTPTAQNNWDSNAAAGHPSQGLLQVIDSTFAANMANGHGDIWNPVDNAAASINYIRARYGSPWNLAGVNAVQQSGDIHSWIGYADGGYVDKPTFAMIGEGHDSEIVSPVPMLKEIVRENSGGGDIHVNFESGAIVTHPGQSNTEIARMVVEEMGDRMLIERRRSGFPG